MSSDETEEDGRKSNARIEKLVFQKVFFAGGFFLYPWLSLVIHNHVFQFGI
jgi:hypothetical protein